MLPILSDGDLTPVPARVAADALPLPDLGPGKPAGDSGAGGPGRTGAARTTRRGRGIAVLFGLIDETHPNAVSRLDRLDGVGGDAA